jgi:cytochrome P450
LPDHEVADNILTLIAAGYDTSCSAASLACKYLAAHPAIMDDIYQGFRKTLHPQLSNPHTSARHPIRSDLVESIPSLSYYFGSLFLAARFLKPENTYCLMG